MTDTELEEIEEQKEMKAMNRRFHAPTTIWSPKQITALLGSAAALLTALAAFYKPTSEPLAAASYKVLADARARDEQRCLQNHDDIIALRSFLYGYLESQGINPDQPSKSRLSPVVSPVGSSNPPPDQPVPAASDLFNKLAPPSVSRPKIGKINPSTLPALPYIGPATLEPIPLPPFDLVKKSAEDGK